MNERYFYFPESPLVEPIDGQNAGHRSIKIVNEPPKLLEVELLSSKSKVSATVDGATVSFKLSMCLKLQLLLGLCIILHLNAQIVHCPLQA